MLHHRTDLPQLFHALADPTRLAIVERLAENPAAVKDLAEPMDMSLTAVMQHLRVLEEAGVISSRKEGRTRICTLDESRLFTIENWIAHRRAQWERRFDRLNQVLARNRTRKGSPK